MISQATHELQTEIARIMSEHSSDIQPTYGRDLIDFPADALILETIKFKLDEDELELCRTTEVARPAYEWLFEITLQRPDSWNHYLIRSDAEVVEAYGKDTFPAEASTLTALLTYLRAVR